MEETKNEVHAFQVIVLNRFLSPDHIFFDIGAGNGAVAIYAAPKCKAVWAFEPDPVLYTSMRENIEAMETPNIASLQAAAGVDDGMMEIGRREEGWLSMYQGEKDKIKVASLKLSQLIRSHKPNLIKMDIAGSELYVLPACTEALKQVKPTLYLSLHTPLFENPAEYIAVIQEVLYLYPNLLNERGEKIDNILDLPKDSFTSIIATFENELE